MIGKYKIAALCICRIQDRECFELIHELDGQLGNIGCRLLYITAFQDLTKTAAVQKQLFLI